MLRAHRWPLCVCRWGVMKCTLHGVMNRNNSSIFGYMKLFFRAHICSSDNLKSSVSLSVVLILDVNKRDKDTVKNPPKNNSTAYSAVINRKYDTSANTSTLKGITIPIEYFILRHAEQPILHSILHMPMVNFLHPQNIFLRCSILLNSWRSWRLGLKCKKMTPHSSAGLTQVSGSSQIFNWFVIIWDLDVIYTLL